MNILPFISALILLFALGSYSLVYKLKATTEEKRDYQDHLNVQRKLLSTLQHQQFVHKKAPSPHKKAIVNPDDGGNKGKAKAQRRAPASPSFRNKLQFSEENKLHIGLLFSSNPPPLLERITVELIRRLYEFTSLYTPGMENRVVATIKKIKEEHPEIASFEELYRYLSPEAVPLFYPLMKGTQAYTLFENRGYPALPDFLSLKKKKSPLCFAKAHKVHLLAFFGDSFTGKILEQEEEIRKKEKKNRSLLKREFEPLLASQGFKNSSELVELLHFSPSKKKEKPAFIIDEEKGLTLKIPCPETSKKS